MNFGKLFRTRRQGFIGGRGATLVLLWLLSECMEVRSDIPYRVFADQEIKMIIKCNKCAL